MRAKESKPTGPVRHRIHSVADHPMTRNGMAQLLHAEHALEGCGARG